jgi:hypothetical protein
LTGGGIAVKLPVWVGGVKVSVGLLNDEAGLLAGRAATKTL